jgi:predicted amidohydrolase
VLVLPAAWVKGPLKEHHWATLLAARALDTTCYVVAAGECGTKNIGQSRVVDPLGVTIAAAAEAPFAGGGDKLRENCACASAITRSSQSSVCATAIIVMFFSTMLDSPCYRLLLCARAK